MSSLTNINVEDPHSITMEAFTSDTIIPSQAHQIEQLSILPQVLKKWHQPVKVTKGAGPSTIQSQDEKLHDLYQGQLDGLKSIAQQLLCGGIPNADYEAIFLAYKTNVKAQRKKLANEAANEENVDAWLSSLSSIILGDTLKDLRQEYLMILSCNAKHLTPDEVYEVINATYKSQLKYLY